MSYDGLWVGSRIFRDESKLQVDYIPKNLPHREEQLRQLREYFKPFLASPGSVFVRVILVGDVGTGKTAVAKKFGESVDGLKTRGGAVIRYSYVNCHANRSFFSVLQKIGRDLGLNVPRRGYSREELLYMIWNHLKNANKYLVVTIDEADYITGGREDTLYNLTRLSEVVGDTVHRAGIMFVFRDLQFLILDPSIQSTLQHNLIRFYPYTSQQLMDILWRRILEEGALYESAASDEVLGMIAELVGYDKGGRGDARLAIELLYRAGKYAESEGRGVIEPEDVRRAYSDIMPVPREVLRNLKLEEKLLLLALARLLQRKKFVSKIPMGLLEMEYQEVCEEYGVPPRRHTTVWEYVQNLKRMGIVSAERSGKGQRGRTTLVGLSAIPLQTLERELITMVREEIRHGASA
ncbi:MAG: ORC1-type DNA replication protein [Thermofilaceae archaeon]